MTLLDTRARTGPVARLNPIHLMVAGVVMALLFVATLIFIVHWVAG